MMTENTQLLADDNKMLASIFEERAEHLSSEELNRWSAETPHDREVLAKLKGPGAKLLVGPRGSGKSTLLRKAYFSLTGSDGVLAEYVNFARSLALDPLFHKRADALQLFRQWVLYKIVDGMAVSFSDSGRAKPDALRTIAERGSRFIHDLETGVAPAAFSEMLAPSQLLFLLEGWTEAAGCRRCVLLLDDAAHAFSPEQQREFFEIFRSLRSRVVSAKAAVYPGITTYSPNFHVGHEAELVEAWYQPDSDEYLGFACISRHALPSIRLSSGQYGGRKWSQKLCPCPASHSVVPDRVDGVVVEDHVDHLPVRVRLVRPLQRVEEQPAVLPHRPHPHQPIGPGVQLPATHPLTFFPGVGTSRWVPGSM